MTKNPHRPKSLAQIKPFYPTVRQNMHDESAMAGFAFTNSWLGIAHSLAHQLGGMYHIPHGVANAIVLPNVIRFNSKATNRFEDLAAVLGKQTTDDLAQEVEALRADINVVGSVKDFGVNEEEWTKNLKYIANNSFADPCTGFNPRKPTVDDLVQIFQACYDGVKVNF